jgi:hypothetical protein
MILAYFTAPSHICRGTPVKNKHNGTSVIVNLTSNKVRSGDDCPMSSTDHPWIKKDCWVCFQDALCVSAVQWNLINNAIASKKIIPQVKTGDKTIERIVLEAKKTSALPKICLPYLD